MQSDETASATAQARTDALRRSALKMFNSDRGIECEQPGLQPIGFVRSRLEREAARIAPFPYAQGDEDERKLTERALQAIFERAARRAFRGRA